MRVMNATPEYGRAVSEEIERLRAERDTLQAQLAAMGRRRRRAGVLLPVVNTTLGQLSEVSSGLLGQDVTVPTITSGELPEQARARINDALGIELPGDVGQIPVYDADELVVAQQALRLFDRMLVLLVVAAPLLVFEVSWGWFLAIIALLACWELMLWRLGGGAGVDTIPTPAPQ
jgi:hypothetical protein